MNKLLEYIYRGTTRLIPSDITYLLVRDIPDTVSFEDSSDFQFTELMPDQLDSHVSVAHLQLGPALIDDMRQSGFRFYAALIDSQIAGYLLVGTDHIPAHHNSAGTPFAGAGLELPDHLVTTTDWTNYAALGSFRRSGFKRVGMVAEFVFLRRHFYKLPPPVHLDVGKEESEYEFQSNFKQEVRMRHVVQCRVSSNYCGMLDQPAGQ